MGALRAPARIDSARAEGAVAAEYDGGIGGVKRASSARNLSRGVRSLSSFLRSPPNSEQSFSV